MLSKLVLSTYLVGSAAASALAFPEAHINDLVARQTDGSACSIGADYSSILASKPTVGADVASAAATFIVTRTDVCAQPAFTGSLSEEWASYTSAEVSWLSANSAGLKSALTSLESACPGVSSLVDALSSVFSTCTSTGTAAGTSAGTSATASPTAASSKGASAPMQTVMAAGVAVVAGAMGILAL